MKNLVRFTKMHGAGNDYIYVDTSLYDVPEPEKTAMTLTPASERTDLCS